MAARQPTIIATSIGFRPEGPDPMNLRAGPSYRLAADLAGAGEHPRLCVIGTAGGDDMPRMAAVHNAFSKIGFLSSHLTLFPMPNVPDVRAHLLAQDVIWVGGGSTANLLDLWRLHGLDVILRECWAAGIVLQGVSAGSICWHIGGTTDSFGPTLLELHPPQGEGDQREQHQGVADDPHEGATDVQVCHQRGTPGPVLGAVGGEDLLSLPRQREPDERVDRHGQE